jgi:hypothetical protein
LFLVEMGGRGRFRMVILGQGPLSLLAPGCDSMGWPERNRAKDARALGIFGIRSNERTLRIRSHILFVFIIYLPIYILHFGVF